MTDTPQYFTGKSEKKLYEIEELLTKLIEKHIKSVGEKIYLKEQQNLKATYKILANILLKEQEDLKVTHDMFAEEFKKLRGTIEKMENL